MISRHTLLWQTFSKVLISYLIVAIILILGQIYFSYQQQLVELQQHLESIEQTFSPPIAVAFYNNDVPMLENTFKGILADPRISGVAIYDDSAGLHLSAGTLPIEVEQLGPFTGDSKAHLSFPDMAIFGYQQPFYVTNPYGKRIKFGYLFLFSDKSVISQNLLSTALSLALGVIILALISVAIFVYFFHFKVHRPLQLFAREIEKTRLDDLSPAEISLGIQEKNEISLLTDKFNGLISRLKVAYADVHKQKSLRKHFENISIRDPLTNLYNRYAQKIVEENIFMEARREQTPLGLILLDIDYFKLFNDTYGHPQGDKCLSIVGKIIQEAQNRPADIGMRYGGEEFMIVLPETSLEGTRIVAERIQQKLREQAIPHQKSPEQIVTISQGILARIPDEAETFASLLQQADSLLYSAKERGRNRIVSPLDTETEKSD